MPLADIANQLWHTLSLSLGTTFTYQFRGLYLLILLSPCETLEVPNTNEWLPHNHHVFKDKYK